MTEKFNNKFGDKVTFKGRKGLFMQEGYFHPAQDRAYIILDVPLKELKRGWKK